MKVAIDVASSMIAMVYGDGEERRQKVTREYGETIRALAQRIVNDIFK